MNDLLKFARFAEASAWHCVGHRFPRGVPCKSYADLYDGLTLCLADFVDSYLPGIVMFQQKVKAPYSLI